MKLTSMTDFVSWIGNREEHESYEKDLALIYNYETFLKQPLKLEMFVPCVDGVPIEYYDMPKSGGKYCSVGSEVEKQAQEKVLFEFDGGLTLLRNKQNFFMIEDKNGVYYRILKNKTKTTVEGLLKFSVEITLTENALKQIGLKN